MGKDNSMIILWLSLFIKIRNHVEAFTEALISIYLFLLNLISNMLTGFVMFFGVVVLINLQTIIYTRDLYVLDLTDIGIGLIGAYLRVAWLTLDDGKDNATNPG